MRNKSLVILTLCIILAFSVFLSACGSGNITDAREVNMLDVLAEEPADSLSFSSFESLTLVGDFVSGAGNFFYCKKVEETSTTYTFYDVRTLSIVKSYVDTDGETDYDFVSAGFFSGADFFTIICEKDGAFVTSLIYKDGTEIASKDKEATVTISDKLFDAYGLFTFADTAYKQTATGVTLVRENGQGFTTFSDDSVLFCGDKYFWVDFTPSYYSINHIVAYDSSLNPVTEYKFPSYATNSSVFPLANDRALVQYLVEVDTHTIEYDFALDGVKFNKYQFVINTASNSVTPIDLKGLVLYCQTKLTGEPDYSAPYNAFKEGRIKSYAVIAPISDKNVNVYDQGYFNLDENGRVIEKLIAPQNLDEINIQIVAKNRYVLENAYLGASQIIDKSGKVIGSFDNYDENLKVFTYSNNINDAFIIAGDVIYDFDLKKIYEIKSSDEVVMAQHSIYIKSFKDETHYDFYLLKKGDTALGDPVCSYTEEDDAQLILDEISIGGEPIWEYVFCVRTITDSGVSYNYYHENGELFKHVEDAPLSPVFVAYSAKTIILAETTEAGAVYYTLR